MSAVFTFFIFGLLLCAWLWIWRELDHAAPERRDDETEGDE